MTKAAKPDIWSAGSAAAEFALSLPLLLIFVVGAADYGVMAYQETALVAAARAGAEYARSFTNATSIPSSAASLPSGATFNAPTMTYACWSGSGSPSPSPPTTGGACGASGTTFNYVMVTAIINPYTPFLSNSAGIARFFFPSSLSATAYVRVN